MFNNIYTSDKPGFATQPNAFLVSTAEKSANPDAPWTSEWDRGATLFFSR